MKEKISKKVRIKGKVQGVYYRASTQQKAQELELTGFVQNMPDGSVYLEAYGKKEEIEKLIQWCHQGPKNAVVDSVEVSQAKDTEIPNYNTFKISY